MMHAATAFVLLVSLSPEQRLTHQLRSAPELTVAWDDHRIVLKQPKQLLQLLTVAWTQSAVTEDEAHVVLRFGTLADILVLEDGSLQSNQARLHFDVGYEFWTALDRAVSKELGKPVRLLHIANGVK